MMFRYIVMNEPCQQSYRSQVLQCLEVRSVFEVELKIVSELKIIVATSFTYVKFS